MPGLNWPFLAADYFALTERVAVVVAVLILLSSVDDLLIDLWYWSRRLYRRGTAARRPAPLTPQQLSERAEQPIAIMVPAWLEYDVIAKMIENMVNVLDYRHYLVFVGTYANDAATIAEVERMRRRYRQLRRVEVPHDGPTCKADCLNWVVQAIFLHEQQNDMQFAGVVLHDSEDVLHPLELRLFNYLLPRKDMIQLPVASLPRHWYELVAGTYMDEFAECHSKDMVVRESAAGMVPSAGVGTCFSRRALLALAADTGNQPFNTGSLTEDYDIGARLARMGLRSIFVSFPVPCQVRRRRWFGLGSPREVTLQLPLSVQEFFPDTFRAAYRQRARWSLGIGLQGWEQIEWKGSFACRYLLLHDRKCIVTTLIGVFSYVLALQFLAFYVARLNGYWTVYYPLLYADNGWLLYLLWINLAAFGLRLAQRAYFVTKLYGWEHGLLSVPRVVVGNFVNFMASMRAWKLFLSYLFLGKRLAWDKTMHDFPSGAQLLQQRARLGELLRAWQSISEDELQRALDEQSRNRQPLGHILVAGGGFDEETLAEALACQTDLPRGQAGAALVRAHAARLPAALCARHRVLCVGADAAGAPLVAAGAAPPDAAVAELRDAFGRAPALCIVRDSEIAAGLRLLRGHERGGAGGAAPLGDYLIEKGLLQREVAAALLHPYRAEQHGRIGDYLVGCGAILRSALEQAAHERRAQGPSAGAP
ncbi:glycosyl transferase family protein [Janthinobacterium fluminis]|uniref:Glycosyl transferase family protein n=1 Tax=Janthinobacterium fluminis TaxID=2987524 RepID=A0ABT5JZY4_9BURK|nr:glycosyl transferase family protein [Janthinobacterium fluminis]MDC8758288.1 glycosyl transferase family protein [Janthinobacterium fluminis]